MNTLDAALKYLNDYRWSVIPCSREKIPLIEWKEFQQRRATESEVREWWDKKPETNVGIVTGKVSGLAVIDIDTDEGRANVYTMLPENFNAPQAVTPRGGFHIYCQWKEGLTNRAGVVPGSDLRAEGGYVVAPPSLGSGGNLYKWVEGRDPSCVAIPPLPELYLKKLMSYTNPIQAKGEITLTEGTRNENLFTLVNAMARGGVHDGKALLAGAMAIGRACSPPMADQEIRTVVSSVLDRLNRRERNYAEDVRLWVSTTSGEFELPTIYRELGVLDVNGQANVRQVLQRLVDERVLAHSSRKYGKYRRVESKCDPINWADATSAPMEISLPFELHDWVNVYPGNIIVVAGEQDTGKTAWLLDFIKRNQDIYNINYFSSELAESELRRRLSLHDDIEITDWHFKAYERSMNFPDVIIPDEINVIDYLEVLDQFWLVGKDLSEIQSRLGKGLALVALQKGPGHEVGRGGSFSLEKPRLYITLSRNQNYVGAIAKIIKAKNWKTRLNPNGRIMQFNVVNGAKFIYSGEWEYPPAEIPEKKFKRLF